MRDKQNFNTDSTVKKKSTLRVQNNTKDSRNNLELSRRDFIKLSGLSVVGYYMMGQSPTLNRLIGEQSNVPADKRPNIILILADDMGFSDISCYGSEIQTPNIDRLSNEGVRFSQAYNTARCCPSRAALLTGLFSHQAGLGLMVGDEGFPSYQGYLRDNCVTIAEVMKLSGYQTWMTGKWHVGGDYPPDKPKEWHPGQPGYPTPLDRGFDNYYGTLCGAGSYYKPPTLMDEGKFVEPKPGFYYTDALGERACEMIKKSTDKKRPFFGYVAFTAPHWPLHALSKDIELYCDRYTKGWDKIRAERYERQRELGIISPKWELSPLDPEAPAWNSLDTKLREWNKMRMAVYAAQIHRLDQNIGTILNCLDSLGVIDNTVVIFLSDNGACAEHLNADGSNILRYNIPMTNGKFPRLGNILGLVPGPESTFMSYDLPWANASDTPLRKYKKYSYEGGISTPLIIRHPSFKNIAGKINDQYCHIIDIMPTTAEMAGAKYPQTYRGEKIIPLEGRSLMPILTGKLETGNRPIFWEHMGNRAVRIGSMKLVADNDKTWELYDLEADRTEIYNLSSKYPRMISQFKKDWENWANRVGVVKYDELKKSMNSHKKGKN